MHISNDEWLDALKRISEIRSERLKADALSSYNVESEQLELLKTSRNEILFGRRGTGKTHLLRALLEHYSSNFEAEHVIPIFLDLQQMKGSPHFPTTSAKEKADFLFRESLRAMTNQLLEFAEANLTPTWYERLLGTGYAMVKADVEEKLWELDDLVKYGEPVLFEGNTQISRKASKKDKRNAAAGLKAELGAKSKFIVFGGARAEAERTEESTSAETMKAKNILKPASVRALVEAVLRQLQVGRLLLIFDEWVEMDYDTQPEFAELLKRHFFGVQQVTIKISANRLLTRVWKRLPSGEARGVQIGDDIFECCDLDRAHFEQLFPVNGEATEEPGFFLELLYKRLSRHLPAIQSMCGADPTRASFTRLLCVDQAAFSDMLRASHGNPRDFLSLFLQIGSKKLGRFNESKVSILDVRTAARAWCRNDKIGSEMSSTSMRLLRTILKDIYGRGSGVTFCLEPEFLQDFDLQDLLEKRLIHLIPHERLPAEIRAKYESVLVDYGYYVDFMEAENTELFQPISEQFSSQARWKYVVFESAKLRRFKRETEEQFQCYLCKRDVRVFKNVERIKGRKKVCPECMEKIAEVEGSLRGRRKRSSAKG